MVPRLGAFARALTALALVGAAVALLALLLTVACADDASAARVERGPIYISSDDDFTAANGVVSGSGTLSRPYVIEGYTITNAQSYGVIIKGTESHFILRDVGINGTNYRNSVGILLQELADGRVENVQVRDFVTGISLYYSDDCILSAATVGNCTTGLSIVSCRKAYCSYVQVNGSGTGIDVRGGTRCTLESCNVSASKETGVKFGYLGSTSPERHTAYSTNASGGRMGFLLDGARYCELRDCAAWDNALWDVELVDCLSITVGGCELGAGGLVLDTETRLLDLEDTNTVLGEPIVLVEDAVGGRHDADVGQLILVGCVNFTVANLTFEGVHRPLQLLETSGCAIENVTINGSVIGVSVIGRDTRITGVEVRQPDLPGVYEEGMRLEGGDASVSACLVSGGNYGIRFTAGAGLDLANTTVLDVAYTGVHATGLYSSSTGWTPGSVVVRGCEVNGALTGVYVQECDVRIEDTAFLNCELGRGVFTSSCDVVNITRCLFEDCYVGTLLMQCDFAEVADAVYRSEALLEYCKGIQAYDSLVRIRGTSFEGLLHGVFLNGAPGSSVDGSEFVGNSLRSISVESSDDCVLSNNSIAGSGVGVEVTLSIGATVRRTLVRDCITGLYADNCTDLIVVDSTFDNCTLQGIALYGCGSSRVYHNNLLRNNRDPGTGDYLGPQALDDSEDGAWDDGSEGNFWSDYTARYPSATSLGRVWDTPYRLASPTGLTDRYPLTLLVDIHPPVADAGPDLTVPEGSVVTLDGSASTDDMGIVAYAWSFIYDGGLVTYDTVVANHTFDVLDTYVVVLAAVDAWGNQGTDVLLVHVVDMVPPVAVAPGDITVEVGEPFHLDGSASSDDHGVVRYGWTVDPGGLDLRLEGANVSLSIGTVGDYTVVLNVTDAHGNFATATLTVHVRDMTPPVPDAGPDVDVDQHETVAFNGTASTDNVGVAGWTWWFDYGGGTVSLEGATAVFTFDEAGEYIVHLHVTDAAGNLAEDVLVVRVRDTEPPLAEAGPDLVVDQGDAAALDGRGSRDNVGIVRYRWTAWVMGSSIILEGAQVPLTVREAGTFTVELEVIDAAGNRATDSLTLRVRDRTPPSASAGPDIIVDQHVTVAFDSTGSVDDVGIVTYVWTFTEGGEPVTLEDPQPRHVFHDAGRYEVTLRVTDAAGNEAFDAMTVYVRDIEPPVAVAGPDRTVVQGDALDLDARGSHDNVGVVTYAWTVIDEQGSVTHMGAVVTVATDVPGSFRVELRVTDSAGNVGYDTLGVTVLPLVVNWRLGPFMDGNGNLLHGVGVTVTLNGTERAGLTDETGWLVLQVVRFDLVSPAEVTASKSGYDTLQFTTDLDGNGDPVDPVPVMRRRPEPGLAPGLLWGAAMVLLVALASVVVLRLWGKKGKGEEP